MSVAPPRLPAIDAMLMIRPPPPCARIRITAARFTRNVPLAFTSMMLSHSASLISAIGRAVTTPAALTTTSTRPKRSTVRANMASTATASATSPSMANALAPISSATASAAE